MSANTPPEAVTVSARADPDAEQLFYALMMKPVDDPVPDYHRLRELAPALLTGDGTLVLSRHADCDAALRNRSLGKGDEWLKMQLKNVSKDKLRGTMQLLQRSMILANPPDHTRLRGLVSSAFTGRHVEALRPTVTRRTDELLDELADRPGEDLMTLLAVPLPVGTIGDLLGIPGTDRPELIPVIHELGLLMEPAAGSEEINRGVAAQEHLAAYLTGLIAHKRAHPADDLLGRLAAAQTDNALDETEMVATALLLFGAGNTPTANLIGNGLDALFRHPDELRRLREDPGLLRSAVEEMLRYDSPSQFDAFTVLRPHTFAGAELKTGQSVIMLLGAANHDPERFHDPDRFDVGRRRNAHLSFAAGIHHCLGAPLARLQAEVFFGRLLTRFPDACAGGPAQRHPGLGNRGFSHLPVNLQGQ
ncbi:cytochrome P450 [Streptomyces sp. NBC_01485]|uniref:cytochrome P450 n=1 Tax=Streptomyces sp. NBC_01485 TaxID=2903884 RepID=UPI002E33968D|nr:cytochrome P450 [Streptomyces sp. NBC_01485]